MATHIKMDSAAEGSEQRLFGEQLALMPTRLPRLEGSLGNAMHACEIPERATMQLEGYIERCRQYEEKFAQAIADGEAVYGQ